MMNISNRLFGKQSIEEIKILNPKLNSDLLTTKKSRIYPYYAGFSSSFVDGILNSLPLSSESVICDLWNGSGTTMQAVCKKGAIGIGIELNPVMVVASKASLISVLEIPGLFSLAKTIVELAQNRKKVIFQTDPLRTWLRPHSAAYIRTLEAEINKTLISHNDYLKLNTNEALAILTPIAAFFYVVLFRATRRILFDFISKNPTWVKKTNINRKHKIIKEEELHSIFLEEVKILSDNILFQKNENFIEEKDEKINILLENAQKTSIADNSVDVVISSPPYCTRIDYAVATSIELALLRFNSDEFELLRRNLTGTSTVEKQMIEVDVRWGDTCKLFLDNIANHQSKASKTYYYKNHLQYFNSVYSSLIELSRILKKKGFCFLVLQNSYYKDIYNNLTQIFIEMLDPLGLELCRKENFSSTNSMSGLNSKSKKYVKSKVIEESVLCFHSR